MLESPKSKKTPEESEKRLVSSSLLLRHNSKNVINQNKIDELKTVHRIKILLFKLMAVCAASMIAIYIWHLLAPINWCWLTWCRLELLKDQSLSIVTGLGVGLVLSLMNDK